MARLPKDRPNGRPDVQLAAIGEVGSLLHQIAAGEISIAKAGPAPGQGRDEALEFRLRAAVIARLKQGGNEPVLVSELAAEHKMDVETFEWHCADLLEMKKIARIRGAGTKVAWMWRLSAWAWRAVKPRERGKEKSNG